MNADGSGQQRLTRNGGSDDGPAWSPDGQRIAYVSYRNSDDRRHIYVMNADGSDKRQLSHPLGLWHDWDPAWSPDGGRIAFTRSRGSWSKRCTSSCDDVYVMNADGSAPRNLTPGVASGQTPVWSPDGRTIAFQSDPDRDGNSEVYLVNADGSGQRRLTRTPADESWSWSPPAWSPDGRRIAFASQSGIYVMNADGTRQRRLTEGSEPVWSPDGRTIVFQSAYPLGLGVGSGIYVVNTDGSGQRQLTHRPGGWFDWLPAWSPGQK
jgi:TolB protein